MTLIERAADEIEAALKEEGIILVRREVLQTLFDAYCVYVPEGGAFKIYGPPATSTVNRAQVLEAWREIYPSIGSPKK